MISILHPHFADMVADWLEGYQQIALKLKRWAVQSYLQMLTAQHLLKHHFLFSTNYYPLLVKYTDDVSPSSKLPPLLMDAQNKHAGLHLCHSNPG